jgi:ribonuclease HI
MFKSYVGKDITNQRMELLACIEGIKSVYSFMTTKYVCKLWEIEICTDSMYTIQAIRDYAPKWILYGWHRCVNNKRVKVSNLDLIKELYTLCKTLPITFRHIASHTKEPNKKDTDKWEEWYGNNHADKLAIDAMRSVKT